MPIKIVYVIFLTLLFACDKEPANVKEKENVDEEQVIMIEDLQSKITQVSFTGQEGGYQFSVGISSPDTGCDQYADWWEVLTVDSQLVYRRILAHSHVDEQPFIRSGGPVPVDSATPIYVRAHMNNLGYGSLVFSGSIDAGLVLDTLPTTYGSRLLEATPLPGQCAF